MAGPQDIEGLAAHIEAADDRSLARIVAMIDRLRHRGAIDRLLDPHRPRLARIRPPRAITLERVLTLPLEDLLIDDEPWSPGVLRIPRAHLPELHKLAIDGLEPGLAETLRAEAVDHTMHDGGRVMAIGERLWPAAGEVLANHAARAKGAAGEARALAATARIAGSVLGVGAAVVRTLWALPPRPMVEIGPAAKGRIEALLAEAAGRGRDVFLIVNELILRRCDTPLLILTPLLEAELPLARREREGTAAMVAEGCLAAMREELETRRAGEAEPLADLARTMPQLVGTIEGLEALPPGVRFDRHALRQLKKRAFELIETRLARALEGELVEGFKALAPGADNAPDPSRLEATAAAAASLRLMGRKIGLATRLDDLFERAGRTFTRLVLEETPAQRGPAVNARLMARIRIVELIFGSRHAIDLYRRAAGPARAA